MPVGPYPDHAACVAENADKDDPDDRHVTLSWLGNLDDGRRPSFPFDDGARLAVDTAEAVDAFDADVEHGCVDVLDRWYATNPAAANEAMRERPDGPREVSYIEQRTNPPTRAATTSSWPTPPSTSPMCGTTTAKPFRLAATTASSKPPSSSEHPSNAGAFRTRARRCNRTRLTLPTQRSSSAVGEVSRRSRSLYRADSSASRGHTVCSRNRRSRRGSEFSTAPSFAPER